MYGVETDMSTSPALKDRYESIPKRDFKTALVRHLEDEYGILRSRRIILMLADDIEDMVGEYFPMKSRMKFGDVVWYTTADDGQRVSYGKKTEDYNVKQVILPLIIRNDIESRMAYKDKSRNGNYRKNKQRDIKTMVRLIKSAKEQGGLLSGAEVSVLMNRSLSTIGKYLKAYHEETGEILPMKGYVLDQGSNPTHKGIIISLYEQGVSPSDIVLKTGHNQESVDRYIKAYDQVLQLTRNHHGAESICEILGRSMHTVRQYLRLVKNFHPEMLVDIPGKVKNPGAEN
ncbi:DUF1670 domain-containing protein [Candidatus Marinimicrobia bacterium MT.SAG.2]|nr:DUF1670 domain-containing protein [Candidatus Marinimicrobia bacterium MT.SAG.2]